MATVLLRLVSKGAVAAGALYVTAGQGVWNNSRCGSDALKKVKGTVLPAANGYAEQIPSMTDIERTLIIQWNSGVKMAFCGLSAAPDATGEYTKKAVTSSTDFLKQSLS